MENQCFLPYTEESYLKHIKINALLINVHPCPTRNCLWWHMCHTLENTHFPNFKDCLNTDV